MVTPLLKSQYERFKQDWKKASFDIFIREMEDLPETHDDQCAPFPDECVGRATIYMLRAYKAGWEALLLLKDFEDIQREQGRTSMKGGNLKVLKQAAADHFRQFVTRENDLWNSEDDDAK